MDQFLEFYHGFLLSLTDGSIRLSFDEALFTVNIQTQASHKCYSPKDFQKLLEAKKIKLMTVPISNIMFSLDPFENNKHSTDQAESYSVVKGSDLISLIPKEKFISFPPHDETLPFKQTDWGILLERKTDQLFYSIEYLDHVVNGGETSDSVVSKSKNISTSTIRKKADEFAQKSDDYSTKIISFEQIDHKDTTLKPSRGNNQEKYVNDCLRDAIINHFNDGLGNTTKNEINFLQGINMKPKRHMFTDMFDALIESQHLNERLQDTEIPVSLVSRAVRKCRFRAVKNVGF